MQNTINSTIPVGYDPISDIGLLNRSPIEIANIKAGDSVLHLGSGTGDDAFAMRRLVGDNGRIIGIDLLPDMLAISRQNAGNFGFNNVTFFQRDISKLLFDSNSFDIVVSSYFINIFPNKENIFAEILRILKPNGHLVGIELFVNDEFPNLHKKNIAQNYFKLILPKNSKERTFNPDCFNKNKHSNCLLNTGFKELNYNIEKEYSKDDDELLLYLDYENIASIANKSGILRYTYYATK